MKNSYLNMELMRFSTAGNVDDGKSTLIGRLLYDSKAIFQDQYESIQEISLRNGEEQVNLALLTDGLKEEREQGITIDVAYRYFATPKRKFIIADTPGHFQYTKNMVTGASTCNLSIILIDARKGIVEQTKRHAFIASLLGVPHLIFAINKMDLVEFDADTFYQIKSEIESFVAKLNVKDIQFVPISALKGDNVVEESKNMDWYRGGTLMYLLENVHVGSDYNHVDCRFPVQHVIRSQSSEAPDYCGYAGRVFGGVFKKGDEVVVLPSGESSKINTIKLAEKSIEEAFAPMSVSMTLEDNLDVSRGDMIVRVSNKPTVSEDIEVIFVWLSEEPLNSTKKYIVKHSSNEVKCSIKEMRYKIDINTLHRLQEDKVVEMNDIARIAIVTSKPLLFDRYERNRNTGSLILIDEATNKTVAAGMIV